MTPDWIKAIEKRHLSPERLAGKTFYQGHELADIEALLEHCWVLREALESAVQNDATEYNHHQPRKSDGKLPKEQGGTIWLTPKEIARRALNHKPGGVE